MRRQTTFIPINRFDDGDNTGISIERISVTDLLNFEDKRQSERHDRHTFHLLEKGVITAEIDFREYRIECPSLLYMHPSQVHRILTFQNVQVTTWALDNDNLNPDYLKLLDDIAPVKPLLLNEETFSIFSEAVSLSLKFAERKQEKLHHLILKDSCNTLVALTISQFMAQAASADSLSRPEIISKSFKELLERSYTTTKRPAEYAQLLNISTAYLNECVKNTTGHPVSYHIQQRIILEAKRLLHHSDKSVKEIAAELGYDDYPYFSRLFTKVTGSTALAFRTKNHD